MTRIPLPHHSAIHLLQNAVEETADAVPLAQDIPIKNNNNITLAM